MQLLGSELIACSQPARALQRHWEGSTRGQVATECCRRRPGRSHGLGHSLGKAAERDYHRGRLGLLTTYHLLPTTYYYSLLTTHYSLLTTHYSLLTTHYSLLTIHYPLPTTHYPLPTTHYPLPTTHYPLPTTHYLSPRLAWTSQTASRRSSSSCALERRRQRKPTHKWQRDSEPISEFQVDNGTAGIVCLERKKANYLSAARCFAAWVRIPRCVVQ